MSNSTHYFRPYAKAMMERSNPDMSRERETETRQRDNDERFVRRLAEAFRDGHHLPAGTVVPLTLIG